MFLAIVLMSHLRVGHDEDAQLNHRCRRSTEDAALPFPSIVGLGFLSLRFVSQCSISSALPGMCLPFFMLDLVLV